MGDFFGSLVEQLKDEDTSIVADGRGSAEFTGYLDTGCLALNAVLSGTIFGGIPNNKVGCFAGESSVGKTFFVLSIVNEFLKNNPTGGVVYYDTEAAITREMMETRGIDTRRVVVAEPDSIQKFRHHVLRVLDNYTKTPEKDRPPMLMVLDSLGILSTSKELEDTFEGKDTKDMTRAGIIRATFRVIRLKLAKARVPLLMTNHVYAAVGCLETGTAVAMADGSSRPIEALRVGDVVATMIGPRPVTATFSYPVEEMDDGTYEIEFDDGSTVVATRDHKFLCGDMVWRTVDELGEDDTIICSASVPNIE